MATIRELTARLGFEFDPTPATRFDAAINRSRRNLEGLNRVNLNNLRTALLKGFKIIGGAAAAAFGIGFAGFLKFSDVAQALTQLRLQAKDSFEPIRSEIKNILADPVVGKLTNELELLNGVLAVLSKGIDPGVLIRTLKPALEFAIATRQSVADVTQGISSFIADANTDLLVQLGIFDQAQLELLKVAGIDPGKQGLVARKAFLEERFAETQARTRKLVEDLVVSGAVAQKELANTVNELLVEIGKKSLPLFKDIIDELVAILDSFIQFLRGEITVREVVFRGTEKQTRGFGAFGGLADIGKTTGVKTDESQNILTDFFSGLTGGFRRQEVGGFRGGITSSTTNNTDNTNTITINAPISVQAGATDDGSMIARKVGEELRKVIGTAKEQSERTTVIRGNQ